MSTGITSLGSESQRGWADLGALCVENWLRIAATSVAAGVLAVGVTLGLPKKYTTRLSFTPVAPQGLSVNAGALAGLVGDLGVRLGGDAAASPEFYVSVLQSESVIRPLAEGPYSIGTGAERRTGSFASLYAISESDSGRTLAETYRRLRQRHVLISFDRQTAIVTVQIRTKWRELSVQMGERVVALLDTFNLASRQRQAAAEQDFLRARLTAAERELRVAETNEQQFLLKNRSFANDPILVFEHSRLQRDVGLRQDVFAAISQSHEQARLAAVRNTPSISLIDAPSPALRFDRRHTLVKLLAAMAAGAILALLGLLAREASLALRRSDDASVQRLLAAWDRSTIRRITRPFSRAKRSDAA